MFCNELRVVSVLLLSSPQLVVCNRHDFISCDLQCRDTFLWHVIKTQRWETLTSSFQRKSITHTNTNKLLCDSCELLQKKISFNFLHSWSNEHLVTTLLNPKNFKTLLFLPVLNTFFSLLFLCTNTVIWVYAVLSSLFLWEDFFCTVNTFGFYASTRVILQLFNFAKLSLLIWGINWKHIWLIGGGTCVVIEQWKVSLRP